MNRLELKTKAKKAISGKILNIFLITLLGGILLGIVTTITLGIAGLLLSGAVMLAMSAIYLGVVTKNRTPEINDLFIGLKGDNFTRSFFAYIRQAVFTFLWTLLFFIPGIVKAISYSMMFFIMADDPKISAADAQKKSMEMTNGHKADLFILYLSFFPWMLLIALTFGLAAIYVVPYVQSTLTLAYLDLKKK